MPTIVGTAYIRILPNTSGFNAALQNGLRGVGGSLTSAGGPIKGLNTQLAGLSQQFSLMGTRSTQAGLAMTYGLTRPLIGLAKTVIDTAAQFDESMKTIAAVAELDLDQAGARKELEGIRDLAIDLGRAGKFSALEIGDAFVEIARAGLDSREEIEGVADTIRKVATVEGTALKATTEDLIRVFTGFGGKIGEVGGLLLENREGIVTFEQEFERMGDILAKVSAATVTDITDLANAFRYAGPVAAAAGLDFEQTATALGLLAQGGFTATVGGTALRGIITRLSAATDQSQKVLAKFGMSADQAFAPETGESIANNSEEIMKLSETLRRAKVPADQIDEAIKAIGDGKSINNVDEFKQEVKKLGLELFDAEGHMIDLPLILEEFQKKGIRVGDAMKLLGQRAGPAFLALMAQKGAFTKLNTEVLGSQGALDKMNSTIEESATIQFARLKNSFIELAIKIGESGMLGFFVDLSNNLREFINRLSDSNPEMFKWIAIVGALVAALGPLNLIIGLWYKGIAKVFGLLAIFTSPLAMVGVAIGALVGFFVLMVARSEALRSSLGALWSSFTAVAGPILVQAARLLFAVWALIGKLAEAIGNVLAPVFNGLAKKLLDFISSGDLHKWLSERLTDLKNFAMGAANAWADLGDAGVFTALGDGIQRVINDVIQLKDALSPIAEKIWPAMLEVGSALGRTVGAFFVILWKAAAGLLSVFEALMGPLKTLANLLGGALGPIIALLITRFFLMRTAIFATLTGIPLLGSALARLGLSLQMMGDKVAQTGQRLGAWLAPMQGSAMAASRLGQVLASVGGTVASVGERIGAAMFRIGFWFEKAGMSVRQFGLAAVNAAMSGLFMGQMAAQAETLAGKVTALASVFGSMLTSILMFPGPLGLILALVTGITALIGHWMGSQKEATSVTIDFNQALKDVSQTFSEMGGTNLSATKWIEQFQKSLDQMDPKNLAIWDNNLKKLGLTTEDFGKAMAKGTPAVNEFVDTMSKRFQEGVVAGQLMQEQWKLTSRTIAGSAKSIPKGDIKNHAIEWKGLATEINKAGDQVVELKGANGDVIASFKSMDEASKWLDERFRKDFLGDAMTDFAKQADLARERFKILQPIIEADKREQADLAERAKTWGEKVGEANEEYSRTKSLIDALIRPQDDLNSSITDFFDNLRGTLPDILKDVAPDLSPPADMTSDARKKYNDWARSIQGDANKVFEQLATQIPAGPPEARAAEFKKRWAAEVEILKGGMVRQFKLSPEQAQKIIDSMFPSAENQDLVGKMLGDPQVVAEQFEEWKRKLLLNPKVMELNKLGSFGSQEFEIVWKLNERANGALTQEQITQMLSSLHGKKDLSVLLNAVRGDAPVGFSWEQISALMQFGFLDIGHLQTLLTISPHLNRAPNLTPEQNNMLLALLTQKGLGTEEINKIMTLFVQLAPTSAFGVDMVNGLLAKGAISTRDVEIMLRFTPAQLEGAGITTEQINELLANRTIVTGHIQSILEVTTAVPDIPGIDENDLIAKMIGGGVDGVTTQNTMTLLTKIQAENPELFAKLMEGLKSGAITPVTLPLNIVMTLNGRPPEEIAQMSEFEKLFGGTTNIGSSDLEALLGKLKGFHFHSGGIVGGGGEDGPILPMASDEMLAVLHLGEAVIPADVVAALGADLFKKLIAGEIPTGIVNLTLHVDLVVMLLGSEIVAAQFAALTLLIVSSMNMIASTMANSFMGAVQVVVAMLSLLRSIFGVTTMVIVTYIDTIVDALLRIPAVMTTVASSLMRGFSHPFSVIAAQVWTPFANMINAAANAFGMGNVIPTGFSIPVFHSGGIAGEGTPDSYSGGSLRHDEMFALLQQGEGVMSQEMMANLTKAQKQELKAGNPHWWAVGGPYESGQSWVSGRSGDSNYKLDEMRAMYETSVRPLLDSVGNISKVGNIASTSMKQVAEGALEWVRGANTEVQKQLLVRYGLPADFDLKGALPEGFDIDHWRDFLGANKGPGNWPLITAYLQAAQVPFLVNSTFRPGGTSYHASGRAVDFGAPNDSNYDSPGLLRIDHALAPLLGVLAELIYSGPGGISDKAYDGPTMAAHHNHVHAALAKGGIINEMIYAMLGESGPEVVLPLSDPIRALALARQSGLLPILAAAQASTGGVPYSTTYGGSTISASSDPVAVYDGGPLGGGPGNTYNIHGHSMDQVKAEIRERDRAAMRMRR